MMLVSSAETLWFMAAMVVALHMTGCGARGALFDGATGDSRASGGVTTGGGVSTGGTKASDGLASTGGTGGAGGLRDTGGGTGDVQSTGGTTNAPLVAKAIDVGPTHACALLSSGSVRCWGSNKYGQLGNGTTIDSSVPIAVLGIANASAVSAGGGHSCALLGDRSIRCWGHNYWGGLGDGTTTDSSVPVAVLGIANAAAIAVGGNFTCALLRGGSVQCWGLKSGGRLGNGTTTSILAPVTAPVTVSGIINASAVSAGSDYACALFSGGIVQCWGAVVNRPEPVTISGITDATDVATSLGDHICALLSGGSVQCWGDNTLGQLGNGTTTSSSEPVAVLGIADAAAVAAGLYHTCALLSDGSVQCWGRNTYGELGRGVPVSDYPPATVPLTVWGVTNATAIAAGQYFNCALLDGGSVQCWGWNQDGQLGNGTTTDSTTPVTVAGF